MKIIGLDLGTKTLGIAISDALQMIASGYETFKFEENHFIRAIERVNEVCKKEKIKTVVIGYPKNMNNSIGPRAKMVTNFVTRLKESNENLEVVLMDERLTSMQASRVLMETNMSKKKRKNVIDKMAAQIILQSYLDSK